ncbi:type I restriction-modification system M protein [Streptococcus pneumoniae]|nr:type I restriction-modification system M protein [Streptococcus pneumoniae]
MRFKSIYWNFGQNKPEKSFRYIDTSSIDRKKNIINYKNLQYLSPEQAPSRARKLVSQNSVLFSTVRPYLKNIAVVRELKEYLIASTAFIVLDTLLNETYLKYYLLSDNFINRVNNKSTGTSYPAINDYNFNLLLIALPPLSEQQRIVEAIESALEKVDEYAELNYSLDQCGFPKEEEEILNPFELIQNYQAERATLNHKIDNVLADILQLLEDK